MRLVAALCGAWLCAGAAVGQARWQPSPGHAQVLLWPGTPPNTRAGPDSETLADAQEGVAGRGWHYVANVSRPTLTVYSPSGENTGAAVLVFPGGGYQILAIDLEGTEACDWLTSRGITCVLLKYRVPRSGPSWVNHHPINPKPAPALQDAQRALGLVRQHAAEWHIDPHKVGVLGFSAGGHLVAAISNDFARREYAPVDAADTISCRPDFAVAVYPGHLWVPDARVPLKFNADVRVTRETPPTFLLQAETDSVDNVNQSLVYYIALKDAGVPVEMHLYTNGGHAFGLRPTRDPITRWPDLVDTWLRTIGVISPKMSDAIQWLPRPEAHDFGGGAPPSPTGRLIDRYVARDGSVSELRSGIYPARDDSTHRVVIRPRGLTLRLVIDDANACAAPHALVHQIGDDSLGVTLFFPRVPACPAVVTPREYLVTLSRLPAHAYHLLLFYVEDGQHPGRASGNPPKLDVQVSGL